MDVDLQAIEDSDLSQPERAIFNVLKATLQYPTEEELREKLANDMYFCCTSPVKGVDLDENFWNVWSVVIDIAKCIPSDHPWQYDMVYALDSLRERGGRMEDLPNLSFSVRELWNDPTCTGEELSKEFAQWKNLNSFVARLTGTGFAPWLNLPIWQLRTALEEPPVEGAAMECRLWVASEWILRCAHLIFQDLISKKELDESTARSLRTGPICDVKPPMSIERWEYWKKRFSELAPDAGASKFDGTTVTWISEAVNRMEHIEKGHATRASAGGNVGRDTSDAVEGQEDSGLWR